jgi:uncharacterized protein YndB with AHSA1/START domain
MTVEVRGDLEIVMSRVFDAPRELVYKAHTEPEHVARWWRPRGTTLPVCEIDLRAGGRWRFVIRKADGTEYVFFGVFREIVPPERLVWTFSFEPMPDAMSVETITFEDIDGKTKVTATSVFDSRESRDGMVASGMESGATETWDRLAEHLQAMA